MINLSKVISALKSLFRPRPDEADKPKPKPDTTADAPKRTDKIYRRKDDWS